MLRSLNDLRQYMIHARDGNIGRVKDFLFDDHRWIVRYLVADTGKWLPKRRVLVSPESIGEARWDSRHLEIALTKERIEASPPISSDEPVSRQLETQLTQYYGWPAYWGPHAIGPLPAYSGGEVGTAEAAGGKPRGDPNLRSVKEVTNYRIEARDGDIGHVEDFIAEGDSWTIRYVVVDTRNWLPGKKVLLAPTWIESVKWSEGKVHVALARDTIKGGPEYDPSVPVNRAYETRLYDYYGRPVYWDRAPARVER